MSVVVEQLVAMDDAGDDGLDTDSPWESCGGGAWQRCWLEPKPWRDGRRWSGWHRKQPNGLPRKAIPFANNTSSHLQQPAVSTY